MRTAIAGLFVASTLAAGTANAQYAPFNEAGVTMGHWHLASKDAEANKKIFVGMGGQPVAGVVGSRMPITNFAKLSDSNISYFISLDATDANPNAILSGDRNWLVSGTTVGAGLVSIRTNSVVRKSSE